MIVLSSPWTRVIDSYPSFHTEVLLNDGVTVDIGYRAEDRIRNQTVWVTNGNGVIDNHRVVEWMYLPKPSKDNK